MSWVVQHLLRNRMTIKESQDIESDEYNNILVIEKKIKELHESGFLSDPDMYVIDLVADNRPLRELQENLGRSHVTTSDLFIQICERIAYFLGGYFTDEGFIHSMQKNYRLSDEDVDKLRSHIKGKFKHKLLRKN
jgi:hypothetical protein